jgi:hypothetical protein
MDYVATYCCRCAQLQWHDFIGKPCQFCGSTMFANVRPPPTFSQIDKRQLKTLKIPTNEKDAT